MNIEVLNSLPGENLTKQRIKSAVQALVDNKPLNIKEKIALNLFLGGGTEDVSMLPKEEIFKRIENISTILNDANTFTLINNYDNSNFIVGQLIDMEIDTGSEVKQASVLLNIELLVLNTTNRESGRSPLNVLFNYSDTSLIIDAVENSRKSLFTPRVEKIRTRDDLLSMPEKYLTLENEEIIFYTQSEAIVIYRTEDGDNRVKIIKDGVIKDSDMGALSLLFM